MLLKVDLLVLGLVARCGLPAHHCAEDYVQIWPVDVEWQAMGGRHPRQVEGEEERENDKGSGEGVGQSKDLVPILAIGNYPGERDLPRGSAGGRGRESSLEGVFNGGVGFLF